MAAAAAWIDPLDRRALFEMRILSLLRRSALPSARNFGVFGRAALFAAANTDGVSGAIASMHAWDEHARSSVPAAQRIATN